MEIITNNRPRKTLDWHELTEKERADFDYRTAEDGAFFVRYRGATYDLSDMPRAPADLKPWDGLLADTYFSGVLVRYVDDGWGDFSDVIMGRCYS